MSKKPVQPAPVKQQAKVPEKKQWRAEDYVSLTVPIEEVKDIKMAFDIFDGDLSGVVDPQELKNAFVSLGFGGQNKFVYQILAELDDDQSGGIDFAEFLRLATTKSSDKDSRAEVDKIFASFDINRAVRIILILGSIHHFGVEEGRPRIRRGLDWRRNSTHLHQGWFGRWWICHWWRFL